MLEELLLLGTPPATLSYNIQSETSSNLTKKRRGFEQVLSISFVFSPPEISIIKIHCPKVPQIPACDSDSPPDRG